MANFQIPAKATPFEQVLKKSRFIGWIAHAASPGEAHEFIESIRVAYPDARHVCWAFVAGAPNNTTQISCSDDGEPSGTAGKPMLNVLQHSDIGEIVAVVVRYFGGIKLGTGGLVRAYSSSVTEALKITPLKTRVEMVRLELILDYALEDVTRRMLENHHAQILEAHYAGQLTMDCLCPADQLFLLQQILTDAGRGQIIIRRPDQV